MRRIIPAVLGVVGGFIFSSLFSPVFAVALAVYTAAIIWVTFELTQRSILKSLSRSERLAGGREIDRHLDQSFRDRFESPNPDTPDH
jgi:hypothetical protein